MDQLFIDKAKAIILKHLEDEDFSVEKLSAEIGLSRSQVLRKIKASTGRPVNKLINDIRLEEAAKLLIKGQYTASEIAYKVGYKNPSYFFKCFHDQYGHTPGEFKTLNKETLTQVLHSTSSQKRSKLNRKVLLLIVILIAISGYFFVKNPSLQIQNTTSLSIGVLPFKNINNEDEAQYLAEGMWDDLLNHLSSIKSLDVRSRQSLERYRESSKSMADIGKELSADYIVECSVQKIENDLKVIIQLIDASNDSHVWSNEYNFEYENIFKVQCEIAKLIAKQLNVVLTDEEEKALEIYPTDNVDAFKLFMQAKYIVNTRSEENLTLGIELLEQAITLDSNFADAYAEMAHCYFLLGALSFTGSNLEKINELNDKALKIDSNTVRVYSTNALFNMGRGNWVLAEGNFKKAIAMNPNDPTTHRLFAFYYARKPIFDAENYLKEAIKAYQLDPIEKTINNVILYAYLQNHKVEEAQEHFNKIKGILENHSKKEFEALIKSHQKKDYSEAIDLMLEAIEEDPYNAGLHMILGMFYNEITNDEINYLKHCKIAYKLEQRNPYTREYYRSLLENKEFEKAQEILNNDSIMKSYIRNDKYIMLSNYYYAKGDYDKALESINSINYWDKSMNKLRIHAKKGNLDSINKIFKNDQIRYQDRAITFAILEERDSMYYYLNKMTSIYRTHHLNKNNEFNLYRNEDKYKTHLKKHYLPVVSD